VRPQRPLHVHGGTGTPDPVSEAVGKRKKNVSRQVRQDAKNTKKNTKKNGLVFLANLAVLGVLGVKEAS
jgi:hypothetical protein